MLGLKSKIAKRSEPWKSPTESGGLRFTVNRDWINGGKECLHPNRDLTAANWLEIVTT